MHPGPVNRGVELAAEVIDSPQALIGQQVAAGVVVRMAVLYECLAGRTRARLDPAAGFMSLFSQEHPGGDVLIRGAHVLDPREGIDTTADVLVRDGEIAELGDDLAGRAAAPRSSTGPAGTCSPASWTRTCTCARRARSTRRTWTRERAAAAAGGFVAVVAMPNTDPTVDSAPVLQVPSSSRPAARRACPSASWPRSPSASPATR